MSNHESNSQQKPHLEQTPGSQPNQPLQEKQQDPSGQPKSPHSEQDKHDQEKKKQA
jgi:hypothetical protein